MVITILAYYPEVPLNVWVFLCLSPSDLSSMYLRNIPLVKSAYRTNWLISFKKTHLTFLVKTTPPPVWLCLVNVIVSKWRRCVCIGNVKAHPDSKGELSGSEWHIEGSCEMAILVYCWIGANPAQFTTPKPDMHLRKDVISCCGDEHFTLVSPAMYFFLQQIPPPLFPRRNRKKRSLGLDFVVSRKRWRSLGCSVFNKSNFCSTCITFGKICWVSGSR